MERAIGHSLGKHEDTAGRTPREEPIASIEALQELERTEADHR